MALRPICFIPNCGRGCPDGEPFCSDHRDEHRARPATVAGGQTYPCSPLCEGYLREQRGLSGEREIIAAKARAWAEHYPQSSDGRNTFILFAEWVESRS